MIILFSYNLNTFSKSKVKVLFYGFNRSILIKIYYLFESLLKRSLLIVRYTAFVLFRVKEVVGLMILIGLILRGKIRRFFILLITFLFIILINKLRTYD